MYMSMKYEIHYHQDFAEQLAAIDASEHPMIFQAIRDRIRHEALLENRNRKPLKRPTTLGKDVWELRLGMIRVFYQVEGQKAKILAVGEKDHNVLKIKGKVFNLDL